MRRLIVLLNWFLAFQWHGAQIVHAVSNLEVKVFNCMFIDDRYEVTVDLDGSIVRLYSDRYHFVDDSLALSVDRDKVQIYRRLFYLNFNE
ncbi:MAG: hypothetical protein ACR2PH_06335 [Desulfobulbia bacterium]